MSSTGFELIDNPVTERPISYYYSKDYSCTDWNNVPNLLGEERPISIAQDDQPASHLIIGETGRVRKSMDSAAAWIDGNRKRATYWTDWYAPHTDGSNVGFADSHVKYFSDNNTGCGDDNTSNWNNFGCAFGDLGANPPNHGMLYWRRWW